MADNRIRIRVRVDDDTHAGFAAIRASTRSLGTRLRGETRGAGRALGLTLARAMSGHFGGAMQALMSNQVASLAVAGAVLGACMLVGAAIAGAIVLAFGASFVGFGVYLLKDNEKVKKAWGKTLGDLKVKFGDAAKPLIPVLTHAASVVGKLGDSFAPHFKKAMAAAAPAMTRFTDTISKGIKTAGKTMFKPLMDGFNQLLSTIGPYINGFMGSMANSMAFLGTVVKDNAGAISMAIRVILQLLPIAIRILAGLVWWYAQWYKAIKGVIYIVKVLWGWIKKAWNFTVKMAQTGYSGVKGKVKTLWGWVKKAWRFVVRMAQSGFANVRGKAKTLWGWVKRGWRFTVKMLQKGYAGVRDKFKTLWNWVKKQWKFTLKMLQRGYPGLYSKLRTLWRWVKKGWKFTVKMFQRGYTGVRNKLARLWGWVKRGWRFTIRVGIVGAAKKLLGFAHGGIVGAAAGGGPRSNSVMVGEQGPEVVDLPPGSRVRSNPDSRRIQAQGNGGGRGGPVNLTVYVGSEKVGAAMIDPLRKEIKKRGGLNVVFK